MDKKTGIEIYVTSDNKLPDQFTKELADKFIKEFQEYKKRWYLLSTLGEDTCSHSS